MHEKKANIVPLQLKQMLMNSAGSYAGSSLSRSRMRKRKPIDELMDQADDPVENAPVSVDEMMARYNDHLQDLNIDPAQMNVKKAYVPGLAIGGLLGLGKAPEGHRLEGTARGAAKGLGVDIGANLGGLGGGLLGVGLGAGVGGLAGMGASGLVNAMGGQVDPADFVAAGTVPGAVGGGVLGSLGGMAAGGYGGYRLADSMLGEPSWKSNSTGPESDSDKSKSNNKDNKKSDKEPKRTEKKSGVKNMINRLADRYSMTKDSSYRWSNPAQLLGALAGRVAALTKLAALGETQKQNTLPANNSKPPAAPAVNKPASPLVRPNGRLNWWNFGKMLAGPQLNPISK